MKSSTLRHLSLLGMLLVVVLWGLAPIAGKYLFNEGAYSPALLIASRGLLSTIALGLFIFIGKRHKVINKTYWICIPAGLIMAGAYLLQFIGLSTTSLSKNTFLESFSLIGTPLTMLVIAKKRPPLFSVLFALLCFLGCFLLCGNGLDFSSLLTPPTIGDILSALGGFLFGVNIAFTKVFSKGKDPYVYVFFQLAILTVFSFGYALPFEKGLAFSFRWNHILVLIFLSLVCTVGCWVLRTICIKRVSAVTTAVFNPLSAVLASSLSILLEFDGFSWNLVLGGGIIVLAVLASGLYDSFLETRKAKTNLDPPQEAT